MRRIPSTSRGEITAAISDLMACHSLPDFIAAVRSSAVDEDGATASFAGQHETYLTIYVIKAAAEKAKSLVTEKLVAALEGMEMMTPAGKRYFRPEDHQAVYTVPGGRVIKSPDSPAPILGDLRVIPAKDYYRHPPFTPISATK